MIEHLFEKFTDRSRKVLELGNQEAQRSNHDYFGAEHILLGLVKEGSGVAANVLKNRSIELKNARMAIGELVTSPDETVMLGKLPKNDQAIIVIQYADEERLAINDKFIGTEHLLFGILRFARSHPNSVVAKVFATLKVDPLTIQEDTLNLLGHGAPEGHEEILTDATLLEEIVKVREHLRNPPDKFPFTFTVPEIERGIGKLLMKSNPMTQEEFEEVKRIIASKQHSVFPEI